MPAHDGLRSDNGYGVKNVRTATIEPNEQGTAGPVQMHPAWRALLQDIELMPQNQDSASSRWRDMKQSPSMPTKRRAIAIIDRDHLLIGQGRYRGGWRFRKRQVSVTLLGSSLHQTMKRKRACVLISLISRERGCEMANLKARAVVHQFPWWQRSISGLRRPPTTLKRTGELRHRGMPNRNPQYMHHTSVELRHSWIVAVSILISP